MTVTAKTLIESKYAASSNTTEYTTPAGARTIIDKLTATNTDVSAVTVSIYLVPSGGSAGGSNQIIQTKSLAAGATYDFTELKSHVLSTGDFISIGASAASKLVIRASGREVT